ncbi:MAG: amidohydrolase family protein [Opitutaceae bacterium]
MKFKGESTSPRACTRRTFIAASVLGLSARIVRGQPASTIEEDYPVIDVHQHASYHGRSDEDLLYHQEKLGVAKTILLPLRRLEVIAAGAGGNRHAWRLAQAHPRTFAAFANAVVYLPGALKEIEFFLEKGAIGIGELKNNVECDSPYMQRVAELARAYHAPMLIHFEEGRFNSGFPRFARMLEKYPDVTFIGHASTFWAHMDGGYRPEMGRRSTTLDPVPGGLTDQWLATYPNLFGGLSASGAVAMSRDPEFTHDFMERHRDKLLFGTDCYCRTGRSPRYGCRGDLLLKAMAQADAGPGIRRKILFSNAQGIFQFAEFAREMDRGS